MRSPRRAVLLASAVALAYLVPALFLLPDYGPTWDCVAGELPFGERLFAYLETGDERFLDLRAREPAPEIRRPHPDFDHERFFTHQVYPLAGLGSALACRLLWTETGLFPALAAHHLVVVLFAAVLVGAVVWFTARRLGALAGFVAAALLVLSPRFFADSFNNLKDVPEASVYTLAAFAGFRALRGRVRDWALAGMLTGLALALKVNAIFLPIQLLATWLIARFLPRERGEEPLRIGVLSAVVYGAASGLAWFGASPHFWSEPFDAIRTHVRQVLDSSRGVSDEVSWEAPLLVLITTPISLLVLAALGAGARSLSRQDRCFLLVGLVVAVGRNLLPGVRNYDGVRHFLEYLPMLAVLGAAGLDVLARSIPSRARRALRPALVLIALIPGAAGVASTHPNGTTYFNALVGGLGGAQARGIHDATDYWGNSYWQGAAWLSANAERDAWVVVPIGEHVVRAAAPVRLRGDLRLAKLKEGPGPAVTYVMSIEPRHESPFLSLLARELEPVHEVRVQGGRILAIYRLDPGAAERAWETLDAPRASREPLRRIMAFAEEQPERWAEVKSVLLEYRTLGGRGLAERIREIVPEEIARDVELAVKSRLVERMP